MTLIVKILAISAMSCAVLAAIFMFIKMIGTKGERGKLLKFALIQIFLFIAVGGTLLLASDGDVNLTGFIMVSVLLTFIANLPLAIVAKMLSLAIGPSQKTDSA